MNRKEIIDVLAGELDRAGSSLQQFKAAVKRQRGRICWGKYYAHDILDCSLVWGNTLEGYEYWEDIHDRITPRVVALAKKGEVVPDHTVYRLGILLRVGCQTLTPKHQKKLFKILAEQLGYEIQE